MGMFNSIFADLLCPVTGEVSEHTEIQIKWQIHEARALQSYQLGDTLDEIEPQYDDTWVQTDYICNACSPKTSARDGTKYIRSSDQRWHLVFIQIMGGRISQIITKHEFEALGVKDFVDDTCLPRRNVEQGDK